MGAKWTRWPKDAKIVPGQLNTYHTYYLQIVISFNKIRILRINYKHKKPVYIFIFYYILYISIELERLIDAYIL